MFSQNLFPIFFFLFLHIYFILNLIPENIKQFLKPLPLTLNPQGNSLLLAVTTKALVWEIPSSQDLPPSLPPFLPPLPNHPGTLLGRWRGSEGQGEVAQCTGSSLYVRFSVWKIREICNITGPVSGSFIHWVLFKGFSSISSKAAKKWGLQQLVLQCLGGFRMVRNSYSSKAVPRNGGDACCAFPRVHSLGWWYRLCAFLLPQQ